MLRYAIIWWKISAAPARCPCVALSVPVLSGWNTGDRQFRDPAHHSVEFSLNVSRSTHRHAHRTNFLGADLARPGVNVLHEVVVCGLQRFTCELGEQWVLPRCLGSSGDTLPQFTCTRRVSQAFPFEHL